MRNLVEQSIVNDVKKIIERGKKIKDPLKGKRSAYIIFCTKKREEAKKLLNPDAKATEVTSKLGQIWNELKKTVDKKHLLVS
jgi:hypothetical protein